MRKIFCLIIFMFLFLNMNFVYAIKNENIKINLNEQNLKLNLLPFTENETIMLPLREIVEQMNAQIKWDGNNQRVIIKKGFDIIIIKIGSIYGMFNDKYFKLEVAPKIIDGSTYVPFTFFEKGLGLKVNFENNVIYIKDNASKYENIYKKIKDISKYKGSYKLIVRKKNIYRKQNFIDYGK